LNPAWQDRIARFRDAAVAPILGPATELTEDGWRKMEARLAPHAEWRRARKGAAVEPLGLQRVREILASDARDRITRLIRRDEALAAQAAELVLVERLVRYHRDLGVLLRNFVNFANFYDPETPAIFDAGRLYLDQRTCHLCIRVENPAAHAASAGMSRMYLAYCDCARPGGEKMTVAAAFTQGDSEQLTVGRNGIFFDRAGRDWDAAVTKVIENPISIHQAFFLPYKRLSRFVSEQIEKFGAAKDKEVHEAATAGLSGAVAGPDPGRAARKEPFDIAKFAGIFAAIGLAIGAIGGALGAMMAAFFSLRWWQMPFALAGVAAVVSGPAMVMAWVKLRQRTLGPVLEGNGWAINGRVRINIPLGNSLTELRQVPIRVRLTLKDPFVDRAARRRRLLTAALIVVLAAAALFYWRAEAKAAFKRAIDALQQAPAPAAAPETPKPAETPKPPAPPA
jgi:hypothetical protein